MDSKTLPPDTLRKIFDYVHHTTMESLILTNKLFLALITEKRRHYRNVQCVFDNLQCVGDESGCHRRGQYRPQTVVDAKINKCINSIMSKPLWKYKCKDKHIVSKWKREARMTERQIQHAIDKCYYYDNTLLDTRIRPASIQGIWYKDNVNIDLSMIVPLWDDFQPQSNDMVVNIIHPSLYPIVFDVTRDSNGDVISCNRSNDHRWMPASKFQWIPAEFKIVDNKTTILSYINNLHHSNVTWYNAIASVFDEFVPLFSHVLTDYCYPLSANATHDAIFAEGSAKCLANKKEANEHCGYVEDCDGKDCDKQELHMIDERGEWNTIYNKYGLIDVEPQQFCTPRYRGLIDLKNNQLQVIVKMANVELTPEKPVFDVGKWHIEGTRNENIVASGIYYYDSSNVTDDALEFMMCFDAEGLQRSVNQAHEQIEHIYGIPKDGNNNQLLGKIDTIMGRCLAFPNNLQHKIANFQLEDKNKCGHRKILAFFLVNPDERILSSANIPYQQPQYAQAPSMTSDEALAYRLQLIEERSAHNNTLMNVYFEDPFSLCEH